MKRMVMAAMLSLAGFGTVQAQAAEQARRTQEAALVQQAPLVRQVQQVQQDADAAGGALPSSDGSFIKQQSAQYNQDPGE